jgi:hypothetical protein
MLHVHHYGIRLQTSFIDQNWWELKYLKIIGNRIKYFKSVNFFGRNPFAGAGHPLTRRWTCIFRGRRGQGENEFSVVGMLPATPNNKISFEKQGRVRQVPSYKNRF